MSKDKAKTFVSSKGKESGMHCDTCKEFEAFVIPAPAMAMVEQIQAFEKKHAVCKQL